ncbi:MAG: ribosome biogenesis GTPase YlqF [Lentisphaeria bacterium]|jgi:ribosome biogenesis GTPase A
MTIRDDFSQYPLTGWYPGHMLKAGRQMQEALKLVDLVVELIDARAPLSSRNPDLRSILSNRPFLLLANKADLANPAASRAWSAYFARQGEHVQFFDARKTASVRRLTELWRQLVQQMRIERGATRALMRPARVMISGIPNIGKSTLVNHLLARNKAQVGPKPGVTRQNQWVSISNDLELLDTPGILWPRIENKRHELMLALIGSLKEELIPPTLLAEFLWSELRRSAAAVKWELLGLTACPESITALLDALAARRGLLLPGGVPDHDRAAVAFLKDYRLGRLGRFTFEMPDDAE